VHLEGVMTDFWHKGAFQNAEEPKGRGFKSSGCTHALKRERHSREGVGHIFRG